VDGALEASEQPMAAVVLNGEGELLALGATGGADPSRDALRPGSTVKPLLALGAARSGNMPSASYACDGRFPPVEGLTCFQPHGPLDLPAAIEQSCNVYFYDIGHRLGLNGVHAVFTHYGFGSPTGLVPGESAGRIPGEAVLRARQANPEAKELSPTFAPVVGIGHGPLQVTLLQLTRAYAKLAGELLAPDEPELAEVKQQILSGLRRVLGPSGTGRDAQVPGLDIAGKTGRAEAGQFDDDASEQGPDNGWFVAFAPAKKPEFVLGVLCKHGGVGARCATPVAGTLLRGALGGVDSAGE
jgi:penicillin-binding protein 2